MTSENEAISVRLSELWEIKEALYREVAHLPIDKALEELLRKAQEAAAKYDLPRCSPSGSRPPAAPADQTEREQG